MRLHNIIEKIQSFRGLNKLVAASFFLSLILSGIFYYIDNKRLSLEQERTKNSQGASMLFLLKGSNTSAVRDWLIDISKISVKGLWLTKIMFTDEKNNLELELKASDQLDIYTYTALVTQALVSRKFCLLSSNITKKGEKALDQKEEEAKPANIPFVLAYLAKKKSNKEVNNNEDKNVNKEINWEYQYQASLKFGPCF